MFGLIKKCMDLGIKPNEKDRLIKAATDYEISGALEPATALLLSDTIRARANVVSMMRMVPAYSNLVDLSSIVNEGVLVGRAGAVTAKAAILAGTNVSGISKGNVGNQVTLKEFYWLFSRTYEELTNVARLNSTTFNNIVNTQFATSYQNVLENQVWNGENGANEPLGLLVDAKDNLGSGSAGDTVRNVDTAAMTTVLERLRGLRDIMSDKYRADVTYFMSLSDLDTYRDEVSGSSSFTGDKLVVENKPMIFDGRPIVSSPYVADNNIIATPPDNMCWVVNVVNMGKNIELQNVPVMMLYSVVSYWQFKFATFDKVAIAYDQT